MFSLTKWIAAPAIALGLMFAGDAPKAEAQYGCYGGGYGGYSGGGGYGISIGVGRYPAYQSAYRSRLHGSHYGYGRRSYYHDTTHLDYHAPSIRRHGDHFHAVPGHYDVHRTGHWHH